jgi:cyclopropane-fatty-acyl-phospholipid synthase
MRNYELIWQALRNIDYGYLEVSLPDGSKQKFKGKKDGPHADVQIKNDVVIDSIISGGDVAFGESCIEGLWTSSNLAEFLTFIALNSSALERFFHARKFKALVLFIKSLLTKNTKRGSKRNILAHYDLGNDFYELWLDETMTYSSAIFGEEDCSLFDAQRKKYHNILSKLTGKTILEIGCGWGGFAEEAAKIGKKIKCLTLSPNQRNFAINRLQKVGLAHLTEIKLQDYREEKAIYDNIVSIEMFEAVGKEYWNKYFQILKSSLQPKGKAILQIITIDEQVFKDYKNRVDFIQKHIFPGGSLPSKTTIRKLAKKYGFEIKSEFAFGLDYSKTLKDWIKSFDAKRDKIMALGFSEEFIRYLKI